MKHEQLIVPKEKEGLRLDSYLTQVTNLSRSTIKTLIQEQKIQVNNKSQKPSYKVSEQDIIQIREIPQPQNQLIPIKIPLNIIYEDDHIIVLNKPSGLVVHPGAGTQPPTLVNGLLHHFPPIKEVGVPGRPGIVHRLDKDTSGLLVIAKSNTAHKNLTRQFKNREVTKVYLTLIEGSLSSQEGKIIYSIGRHPVHRHKMAAFKNNEQGKKAITEYRVLAQKENKSLLKLNILTGRTHQIRVHLAAIGHPVQGDSTYGKKRGKRPLLHALELSFTHPVSHKKLHFKSTPPSWAKPFLT